MSGVALSASPDALTVLVVWQPFEGLGEAVTALRQAPRAEQAEGCG